jgi:hypothetical protein
MDEGSSVTFVKLGINATLEIKTPLAMYKAWGSFSGPGTSNEVIEGDQRVLWR